MQEWLTCRLDRSAINKFIDGSEKQPAYRGTPALLDNSKGNTPSTSTSGGWGSVFSSLENSQKIFENNSNIAPAKSNVSDIKDVSVANRDVIIIILIFILF